MNKTVTIILAGLMGTMLCIIGVWFAFETTKWLIVAAIGFIGVLNASNEFSKLQFGEIEVEEEEA